MVKGIRDRAVTIHGMSLIVEEERNEAVPAPVTAAAMITPAASHPPGWAGTGLCTRVPGTPVWQSVRVSGAST